MAFSIEARNKLHFNADAFAELSGKTLPQVETIKPSQNNPKGATYNQTSEANNEIRRIVIKGGRLQANGHNRDCLNLVRESRVKYPTNIYLYELEWSCTTLQDDYERIFREYTKILDKRNADFHLAISKYYALKNDAIASIDSLQKSIELEHNSTRRVNKITQLVYTQFKAKRYEDAIRSAQRYFELKEGEAFPNPDGLMYDLSGTAKQRSGKYSSEEWCKDIQRAHAIGWRMDIDDRNPDPSKCQV